MKPGATSNTRSTRADRISKVKLAAMIEEATVDAYDESEQATGWFTMFEEHLDLPFETQVLGTSVTVASIDLREGGQIVAICMRGPDREALDAIQVFPVGLPT